MAGLHIGTQAPAMTFRSFAFLGFRVKRSFPQYLHLFSQPGQFLAPRSSVSGERGESGSCRFPSPLYPPVQLVLVDTQIQRDLTRRFLVFPGQDCRFGFKFLGVHPHVLCRAFPSFSPRALYLCICQMGQGPIRGLDS
jgi:hypothetical protein